MASPAYVKKIFNAAKRGSLADLKRLSQISHLVSPSQLPDVLELFFEHVSEPKRVAVNQKSKISPKRLVLSDEIITRAALSTAGLSGCFTKRQLVDKKIQGAVLSILKANWVALKYWLRYFTQYYRVSESIGSDILSQYDREMSPESLSSKLLLDISFGGLRESETIVLHDPFIYKLLMTMWYHQDLTIPARVTRRTCEEWCEETSPFTTKAMAYFLRLKTRVDYVKQLFDAVDNDHEYLVMSALQRLSIAIRAGVAYLLDVQIYTDLVCTLWFSTIPDERTGVAMIQSKAIVLLTKALHVLARHYDLAKPDGGHTENYLQDILVRGFGVICLHINGPILPMRQALRAGLLDSIALLSSTKFLEEDILLATFADILSVLLPHQTLTYHVLEDIVNSCNRFSRDGLKSLSRSGPLAKSWEMLRLVVYERHIVQCMFDRDAAMMRLLRICDVCRKRCPKDRTTICSGCKIRRFCSRKCQWESWKAGGHESECMGLDIRSKFYFTPLDTAFLHHLILTDIFHAFPGIHDMAAKSYPGIPFADLTTTADYTRYTTHVPIFSVAPDRARASEPSKEKQEEKKMVAELRRNAVFVVVKWRLGETQPPATEFCALKPVSRMKKSDLKNHYAGSVPAVKRSEKGSVCLIDGKLTDGPMLRTEEWDEISEVWARAELTVQREGGSMLDIRVLEKVIMEMEQEIGVDWSVYERCDVPAMEL